MTNSATIGALSKAADVNIETIRYYEKIGLLQPPVRQSNGYRTYAAPAVQRLRFIRRGRELGFGIAEIKTLLELADHPEQACCEADALAQTHLQDVTQRISDLQAMQRVLQEIVGCQSATAAHCRLVGTLAATE